MSSIKATAAIALTLMIVVPIGLGYALSFEDVERTVWNTDQSVPMSDLLLNSSTDYYLDYSGTSNNSELVEKMLIGAHQSSIVAPAYVQVGDTYTTMPQYASITDYYDLDAGTTQTVTMRAPGYISSVGTSEALYTITPADYMAYEISSESTAIHFQLDLFGPSGVSIQTRDNMTFLKVSADTWSVVIGESTYYCTGWCLSTNAEADVTVYTRNVTALDIDTAYVFDSHNRAVVKVSYVGGGSEYVPIRSTSAVMWSPSGSASVGSQTFSGVASLSYADAPGYSRIFYSTTGAVTGYADPAFGWTVPNQTANYYWMNGYRLESVTMYASVDAGKFTDLKPMDGTTSGKTVEISVLSNGTARVICDGVTQVLGKYTNFKIVFTQDDITVYGIGSSWPTMGYSAVTYNSIEISNPIGQFDRIQIMDQKDIRYRVDSASVQAGTYPITKDYDLDMGSLYPGKSYDIKIRSLGVYGNTLTLNGTVYQVNGNAITVGDKSVTLKGAVISSHLDTTDNVYDNSINGISLGTSSAPMSMILGGVWSLTASADLVSQSADTSSSEWKAGGFGLDDKGFIAAGLITGLGVFIILGMTGRLSGSKIALLALVCGGACVCYFLLL